MKFEFHGTDHHETQGGTAQEKIGQLKALHVFRAKKLGRDFDSEEVILTMQNLEKIFKKAGINSLEELKRFLE